MCRNPGVNYKLLEYRVWLAPEHMVGIAFRFEPEERVAMALDPETFDTLIDTIRRFVRERLRPLEAEVEAADAIPAEVIGEMKALGLFGLSIAEDYGGLGLTMLEECKVAIELGRTTPAFRSSFGTNVGIGSQGLVMAGTTEQKAEWLPARSSPASPSPSRTSDRTAAQ
jgi:alkylation response protein AidB-like acyl-CoA dehydrogenase